MENDGPGVSIRVRSNKSAITPLLPEVDAYIHLLLLLHLLDQEKNDQVGHDIGYANTIFPVIGNVNFIFFRQ